MISPSVYTRLEAYARQAAPQEACALLIKKNNRWQPEKLANLAANPETSFAVDSAEIERLQDGREAMFFHSHPFGPGYPSLADMHGFMAGNMDWLIADISVQPAQFFTLGHHRNTDLHRRPFRHGVTDCYSLIRDYYHQVFKLDLPEYARGWQWWSEGQNLYRDQFQSAGFFQLGEGDPLQKGDIALMRLRAHCVNHAAIWCGEGLLFHHLASGHGYDPHRQPQYDPAERFAPFIEGWLRHHTLLS